MSFPNRPIQTLILLILSGSLSLACAEMRWDGFGRGGAGSDSDTSPKPSPKPTPPEGEKPVPPGFTPVAWLWVYMESKKSEDDIPEAISRCGEDFRLDSPCRELNRKCHVMMHLYRCEPEGQVHSYRGRVVDQDGKGIEGALVYAGYPYSGMTNFIETSSVEDGAFQFFYPGWLKTLFVQKEGYRSSRGHYLSHSLIPNTHGDWGVYDLEAQLIKMNRSVFPEREVSPPYEGCHIVGRVVDDSGEPIEGATIFPGRGRVFSDATGHYSYTSDQPCKEVCSASVQGYVSAAKAQDGRTQQARDMVSCLGGRPDDFVFTPRQSR